MSFAKGITSAALPLGGIVVSDEIRDAINNVGSDSKYMHAATYSGHATCCAVGLRNIQILEDEKLVERAATMGRRLLSGLRELNDLPIVGDVRGLGLMAGVELAADKEKPEFFDPGLKVGERVFAELKKRGVYTRVRGDAIVFAPPLVISEQQVDQLVEATADSLRVVSNALGR
jgi:adenosylmethionine-8-amino-7-oxononanoate aminotransferase